MVPRSVSDRSARSPGPSWQRPRLCLLRGCERWFRPRRSQCRYCSETCQQAARKWRRWHAQQKYRASTNGRQHRQEQAQRYRQRSRTRASPPPPASPPSPPEKPTAAATAACSDGGAAAGEGKRWPEKSAKVPLCPCDRPGCYVLFAAGSPGNPRRFCCPLCRRALRRVLDREARWRRRRRQGLQRPGRRVRPRARGP